MNPQLERAWQEAMEHPGRHVDIGRLVVCDFCHADYTDSHAVGGVIFGSYAVCPTCAPRVESEPARIRARCPALTSFGDFVRKYRGEDNSIRVLGPE
jgi:hypothetical protein